MFEGLSKDNKLKEAKRLFSLAVSSDRKWQSDAADDFKFRDGDQWTEDEKRILQEELRPVLTFNLTKSSIDLIMGMNQDNRIKHRCSPVEPTDAFLSEVLNDIMDWTAEAQGFEDEEDAALESACICGRGFVGIDFGPDPKRFGEIVMEQVVIPVNEIHFDPAARRPMLDDASYICWDRWMSQADFRMKYPKIKGKRLEEIIKSNKSLGYGTSAVELPDAAFDLPADFGYSDDSDYDKPLDYTFYDQSKDMVRIVHMEYWEVYERYFGFDPQSGQWVEFDKKMLPELKAAAQDNGFEFAYETLADKRVRWMQFCGMEVLFDDVSPMPFDGFSIVPCIAYRDVSMKSANHFGLVRLMKDPQKEVNKRWSQALNMLNQQVQPGVYAESDAFLDDQQAKLSLKESGSITWTQPGAITQGKIKERTVPSFPNAPMQMEQFSQDIMKKITGINPDLLGQDRGRQEPGVVIRLRQQQGVTLLKPLFRNFNNMKKELFKRQLAIIMEYMPDSQILRILGQGERYQIDRQSGMIMDQMTGMTANLRDARALEYNIVAEEAPGNMTKRMLELSVLTEMMQGGFPVDPMLILEKLELSASDKARWSEYINSQQQAQTEEQEEMKQLEIAFKDREIKVDEQRNMLDFVLGLAKINQQADKDDKKMVTSMMQLDAEQRRSIAQFIVDMAGVMQQADAAAEQAKAAKLIGGSSNTKSKT